MKYWVISDFLEWGTYAENLISAEKCKKELIKNGGIDARIEYDPWE